MSRLQQIAPEAATGHAKELLDAVKSKMGMVPNMTRAMVNSPAVLEGYLSLNGALTKGTLPAKTREQISLAVSQVNECEYCLGAHSLVGKMVGLSAEQILDSRRGNAVDSKTDQLLKFVQKVVETRGRVSDADLAAVRTAGFDDGAIAQIVAEVALNIFTNYFNNVAGSDLDFPQAAPLPA